MGYTHYWYRPRVLDAAGFRAFVRDVKRLLKALPERTETAGGYCADEPLLVAGWNGDGDIELTPSRVSFNGAGKLGYETFRIERVLQRHRCRDGKDGFEFCKTGRRPYDLLVCATLIAFKQRFPQATVLSDGDAFEWREARELVECVLGDIREPGPWTTEENAMALSKPSAHGGL